MKWLSQSKLLFPPLFIKNDLTWGAVAYFTGENGKKVAEASLAFLSILYLTAVSAEDFYIILIFILYFLL